MFQDWRNLTFVHWRCDPDAMQGFLPAGLEVDTFDGSAWLGMTPFLLTALHPPGLPSVPWLSEFPETNVRTYVRGPDGEPGIWFFTLESARLIAALGGRVAYGLPYRWARMHVKRDGECISYRSTRSTSSGWVGTHVLVTIHDRIAHQNELERFLTARFRLYSIRPDAQLRYADVEHEPWTLFRAGIWYLQENLTASLGLPKFGEPLVHYSPGVRTRIGRLMRHESVVLADDRARASCGRAKTG